ncbi:ABC transporter permease subunit [Actinomyces culturomici]|uniref:ABC transporter permease subunit n=1 Tax=Actinomyces culturomici TaxID=1926276 RepID=UPI000E20B436|nr:ABC transporter permease subunit [Actinomyces culturomici]
MSTSSSTSLDVEKSPSYQPSHARDVRRPGFFIKLVLIMLVDALGVYGVVTAAFVRSWTIVGILVVLLVVVNYVYFSSRMIPSKYLVPGMIFLLIYQVFVMGYTGYVSLTNYGQGHNSTKQDAIEALLATNTARVDGTPDVATAVLDRGSTLGLAIIDPETGRVMVGDSATPLEAVDGATVSGASITEIPGETLLTFDQLVTRQKEVTGLFAPVSDDPNAGFYVTSDGAKGYLAKSNLIYDAVADTMTDNQTGTVYTASDEKGCFASDTGETLKPGWRVFVGVANYGNIFTSPDLGTPFLKALLWSFAFAILSVLTTFAFGLFLALVFADERVKGRRLYQSLLILPYAFPGFLATLVWRGLLNEKYGFINEVLLGGHHIPWLTDPMLAKVSILGVNLWLGFPYMFLVCMGALQSLPSDCMEAAKIDGASGLRTVWSIKLPLVLQSTVPLLIASFAFNFNNFSLIYMLTNGGPNYPGLSVPVGETDILISMVYKIAFEGGSKDYGLASAMSIVIFLVVGVIAWLGFRKTKALEEL